MDDASHGGIPNSGSSRLIRALSSRDREENIRMAASSPGCARVLASPRDSRERYFEGPFRPQ